MKNLKILFIVIAMLGWVASIILTAVHFWVIPLIPESAQLGGPMLVITSKWAYIGAMPLATIGAIYYIVMIALGALWLSQPSEMLDKVLLPITAIGFVASLGFVYLQLFVINAICPFCMMSAAATTILLIIEIMVKFKGGSMMLPGLQAQKVWAATFIGTALLTILAMWILTILPLPIPAT